MVLGGRPGAHPGQAPRSAVVRGETGTAGDAGRGEGVRRRGRLVWALAACAAAGDPGARLRHVRAASGDAGAHGVLQVSCAVAGAGASLPRGDEVRRGEGGSVSAAVGGDAVGGSEG